jgi:alkylation response protein AidB-like acyl-CoA dehydrogenase
MTTSDSNSLVASLDEHLGDASDPASPGSRERALRDDEREAFPEVLHAALDAWGLHHHYVPRRLGGKFHSFEELLALTRVVARRDLTAAIAHAAVFLGSAPVWLGGSDAQQRWLARRVLDGGAVAFGLTEEAHGSDILASDTQARRTDDGDFVIDGRKWLINNASRSTAALVFARTRPEGGPRGFSVFLLDKREIAPGCFEPLPKLALHGIRGADISGFTLRAARVPESALVGPVNGGLDLALKTLQVTRTLCAALALGSAQSALTLTVRLALVESFVDLLVGDTVGRVAARGLHLAPEQFSSWSAVVKYFVPATLEQAVRRLAGVMGARHFLRQGPEGLFQKVLRDNALIGLFDGSAAVNLQSIAAQLPFLLKPGEGGEDPRRASLFDLSATLPAFDASRLALFDHGADLVAGAPPPSGLPASAAALLAQEAEALAALRREVAALRDHPGAMKASAAIFRHARAYCDRHAAAACIQLWAANAPRLNPLFTDGHALVLALRRLSGLPLDESNASFALVFETMLEWHHRGGPVLGFSNF